MLDHLADPAPVGLHGLGQVVVVEQPVAEQGADEGEPDPAGLSGKGEVFDVDVGHPRRCELNRVARELKRRNTVRRVEADAEVGESTASTMPTRSRIGTCS